jgi:hypothetical protein
VNKFPMLVVTPVIAPPIPRPTSETNIWGVDKALAVKKSPNPMQIANKTTATVIKRRLTIARQAVLIIL